MSRIPGVPETVLVAPDSFKGTFSATEVAAAIGRGLEDAGRPADLCPVADGGEGTLDALAAGLGAERPPRPPPPTRWAATIEAEFGLAGDVALVDTAAASGLSLVAEAERDAIAADHRGHRRAHRRGGRGGRPDVYLGVGGSATTDGGAGAIKAIERAGGLQDARLVVLCDVRTPFEDAARVFAPQKGADADDGQAADRAAARAWPRRLERDPRGVPMTGAAGGLSGGLWAAFGAELVPGAAFVLDEVGFDARMRSARAVVTGEGKLDMQSLVGKVVSEVATRARQSGRALSRGGGDARARLDGRAHPRPGPRDRGVDARRELEAAGTRAGRGAVTPAAALVRERRRRARDSPPGAAPTGTRACLVFSARVVEQLVGHLLVHPGAHDDAQHAEVLAVLREGVSRAPASRARAGARTRRTRCSS